MGRDEVNRVESRQTNSRRVELRRDTERRVESRNDVDRRTEARRDDLRVESRKDESRIIESRRMDSKRDALRSSESRRAENEKMVSRDFVNDIDLKMMPLEKPQWNLFVDSKDILSQFLLGGIAMAMIFKGHHASTKTI